MSRPYPLYDELLTAVFSRREKTIDIKRVCTTINNLSHSLGEKEAEIHYREIAALILHHELVENKGVLLCGTPFNGKVMHGGKGIVYPVANLPPLLQQIITQYIERFSASE